MSNIEEIRARLLEISERVNAAAQVVGVQVSEIIAASGPLAELFEGSGRTDLLELQGLVFTAGQKIDEGLWAALEAAAACERAAGTL
jgi:hypothetical protein